MRAAAHLNNNYSFLIADRDCCHDMQSGLSRFALRGQFSCQPEAAKKAGQHANERKK